MPLASLAPVEIPDRALQSALEFAVGVAAASTKLRPPLDHPSGLKPYLRFQTLPPKALGPVRAAVEADAVFRSRLGQVATRELLDEVGMLWLTRPEGWQAAVADLLAADAADAAADDAVSARREQKRRHAAEQRLVTGRIQVQLLHQESPGLDHRPVVSVPHAIPAARIE